MNQVFVRQHRGPEVDVRPFGAHLLLKRPKGHLVGVVWPKGCKEIRCCMVIRSHDISMNYGDIIQVRRWGLLSSSYNSNSRCSSGSFRPACSK